MIAYGENWIAPEHKDGFIQSLHEGSRLIDQLHVGGMRFVGFWWRVLASVIDSLIKGAINMMFMIPLGLLAVPALEKLSGSGGAPDQGMAAGMVAGIMGAYAYMFVATIVSSLIYEVWMVGKYGGTVGKLALRFQVVNADGSKLSYGKSFARWASEVLSKFICFSISYVLGILVVVAATRGGASEPSPAMVAVLMLVCSVIAYLGCFPWWLAAHTKEKRALHDMMCGTRVIFK